MSAALVLTASRVSRLVPPLSAAQAAAIRRALLCDTLDCCRAEVPDAGLLYVDEEQAVELRALVGDSVPLVRQEGRGIADALRLGMARHAADGPLALVSSDIPGIPQGSLGRAFAALDDGADVVLGPALDGGYWLVAMREFSDAPFRSIPWSTPAVYAVTVRRCEQAGLRVAALETWRDVDTPVDLAFLARSAGELPAPRTRELLRQLQPTAAPPGVQLDSSQFVAGSPWRCVIEDRLLSDEGAYSGYTYLAVPRMVFVVPVTDAGELLLLRRYRHPVRDWTLEVPAGTVDDGETPLEAAERELAEELGATAAEWHHLSLFYPSGSHVGLRADAFLATGVVPDDLGGSDLVALPVAEALELAVAGGLRDAQSALAILLARTRLEPR